MKEIDVIVFLIKYYEKLNMKRYLMAAGVQIPADLVRGRVLQRAVTAPSGLLTHSARLQGATSGKNV